MVKDGETKRQHYVPRFLLRHFSADRKHISLVVLSSRKRVDNSKIDGQCYEDYFYGKDQVMEKAFGKEENATARILGNMSPEYLNALPTSALEQLRMFLFFQQSRTRGSAESLNSMVDAFAKTALAPTLAARRGISSKDLDLVRIGLKDAQRQTLSTAASTAPIILDLDVKFLVTDRVPGFVISDDPAVSYNQYAEHHPDLQHCLSTAGLSAKGIQIFLPLSPSIVLAVYDPTAYQYGSEHKRVCRVGPKDVETLNQMQAVHALRCIYFDAARMTDEALNSLLARRKTHGSAYSKKTLKIRGPDDSGDRNGEIVGVYGGEVKLGTKLDFIRLRDHFRYPGYNLAYAPVRNPELFEATRQYQREIRQRWEQQGAAGSGDSRASSTDGRDGTK